MNKIPFDFNLDSNLTLKSDIYFGDYDAKKPISIVIHGFKGFRNWGFLPYLSEKIASEVGPSISVDFSHNGILEDGDTPTYNVDLFRKNTVSRMLDELSQLISMLNSKILPSEVSEVWNGEINLIGHSLGGALSIITASENDLVKKICIWGTISTLDRNTERQKKLWREAGVMEFKDMQSGQDLVLDITYLQDKENNSERFNLLNRIESLQIPICIIHGKQDLTVRIKEAEALFEASKKNPEMEYHIIEKCGHTFGARHPFVEPSLQLDESIEHTIKFLK